ncbi:hypothetical protein CQW23_24454 [Capsicum baccatum]|uniref:DUF4283 domain-containing protein n=1 Tax=Capsicum baccatum TaxID=33114 RepID=A0A2G2VUW7_CAPBA|nr:hypothetical protein CQW23_24454 [Capsicum baccatum]
MMKIDKPVNVVGDLKCVNGIEREELCISKEKFRTLDGTELNCYAKDCALKTCIVERSDKMMEIENSKNDDDPKHDRQWIVDDASTKYVEVRVKKQKVESLDGVELDCCATNQVKTHAPESIDGVEVENYATNREPNTIEGVEVERCTTHHEHKSVGGVKFEEDGNSYQMRPLMHDSNFKLDEETTHVVVWISFPDQLPTFFFKESLFSLASVAVDSNKEKQYFSTKENIPDESMEAEHALLDSGQQNLVEKESPADRKSLTKILHDIVSH